MNLQDVEAYFQRVELGVASWYAWWDLPLDPNRPAPDLSFLPRPSRRRLSLISKMSLHVAYHALQSGQGDWPGKVEVRSVFASRHGESQVTLSLFEDIRTDEMLSPLQFSRSVHNTSSGLHTIGLSVTSAVTSIAAVNNTATAALLEAGTQAHAYRCPVLCVVADEDLPEMYHSFLDEPVGRYAIGIVLAPLSLLPESPRLSSCHEDPFLPRALLRGLEQYCPHHGGLAQERGASL